LSIGHLVALDERAGETRWLYRVKHLSGNKETPTSYLALKPIGDPAEFGRRATVFRNIRSEIDVS
jgi:hypothetical protein